MEGGAAAGAIAIGATARDPGALGGEELRSEEIGALLGGSRMSADHRETNSSLEPPLAVVVWLKSLGRLSPLEPALAADVWLKSSDRLSPSFGTLSLGASSALMMGGGTGKTDPANTAR